jgi:hypothetical protein
MFSTPTSHPPLAVAPRPPNRVILLQGKALSGAHCLRAACSRANAPMGIASSGHVSPAVHPVTTALDMCKHPYDQTHVQTFVWAALG